MQPSTTVRQVGEVIESTTTQFVAQCVTLHDPPAFGSLVKVGRTGGDADSADPFEACVPSEGTIYAVVCDARTCGLDAGRRPVALGLPPERLQREQPQVFELLRTEFTALTLAHASSGRILRVLPPQPPRVHDFVYPCGTADVRELTSDPDFVRSLLACQTTVAPDELAAAVIRSASCVQADPHGYLIAAGKVIATALADDYRRVDAILRKLIP